MEKLISRHCNVSICYKLKDKRLVVKSIKKSDMQLQEFINDFDKHNAGKKAAGVSTNINFSKKLRNER